VAIIVQEIKIGKGVIIGAGATVIEDIPDNVNAVGFPARVVKQRGDLT
jgi:tetrahydrodipicolinate N-acetyltransferase